MNCDVHLRAASRHIIIFHLNEQTTEKLAPEPRPNERTTAQEVRLSTEQNVPCATRTNTANQVRM